LVPHVGRRIAAFVHPSDLMMGRSSLQDLSFNRIEAAGAASIAEALKVNSTLQQLGAAGAAAIAKALKVNAET
jgi:hypothetical protein